MKIDRSEKQPSDEPMHGDPRQDEEKEILLQVIKLNAHVLGLTLALLLGIGIFIATNILVLKGGPNVGVHLQLLSQFFPGYSVTFRGSFVGFACAGVLGYVSGWIIAIVYNWVVFIRNR